MKRSTWTIQIPDLFWPEPLDTQTLDQALCPTLERWLAKMPKTALVPIGRQANPDRMLMMAFGCVADTPIAPLRWWGESSNQESVPGDDYWLCVDPVQLRFHHEQILLADTTCLSLSMDEINPLIDGLNHEFADLGVFTAPVPDRWYLKLNPSLRELSPANAVDSVPLAVVAGRRLQGDAVHLQSSLGQTRVRQWQNEIQMYLHAHPVNQCRRGRGLAEVNGVWFWGGGVLPSRRPVSAAHYSKLYHSMESPLLQGLARWLDLPLAVPMSLSDPKACGEGAGADDVFLLLNDLMGATRYEDSSAWCLGLAQIDRVLAPLFAKKQRVVLQTCGSYGEYQLDSRQTQTWAFWHQARPLAQTLQRLKNLS